MKKNVGSQSIGAEMVNASSGAAFTGTVTVYLTGDDGTQTLGSVGSGVCTHKGNGYHSYAPSQAETNYNHIAFTFIGTGAIPATVQVYTTFPQTGDVYAALPTNFSDMSIAVTTGRVDVGLIEGSDATDQINAACDAAVVTYGLDHLVSTSVTGTDVADDSIFARLVSKQSTADWDSYDHLTNSLEYIGDQATVNESSVNTIDANVDSILLQTGSTGVVVAAASKTGYELSAAGVDAIWDEDITTHTTDQSAGLSLFGDAIRADTAQAGASGNITLDAGASATTDIYTGLAVSIVSGTGAGQSRVITAYNGTTKVATVLPTWTTNPASGSKFVLRPAHANVATFRLSQPNALASGRVDSSVGSIAANAITASSINTGAITAAKFAAGAIDAAAIATGAIDADALAADAVAEIADGVFDEALAGHTTAGTAGKALSDIEVDTSTTIPAQISGLNNLSAAQVNAEVDTALADIHLDHLLATDYDPAAKPGTATALLNELVENDGGVSRFSSNALEAGLTAIMTESYPTDGSEMSPAQALYMLIAHMGDKAVSGTTLTLKKLDGATTAATFTLDNATPTSITRSG